MGKSVKENMFEADEAWKQKDLWEPLFREAYELAAAGRNPYDREDGGPASMARQFDSTAANAAVRGTNRLMTELTPPDQDWTGVALGPLMEMKTSKPQQEELTKKLDGVDKIVSMVFSSGTFINCQWEAYFDLLVTGIGALLVLEDPHDDLEPVIFQAVSQAEIAITDDAKGQVCRVDRKRKIRARQIKKLWKDAILPKELADLMKNGANPILELQESTYKGDGHNSRNQWFYSVIWRQEGKGGSELLCRTYDTNPWIIYRWSKLPGCPYGPGPVLLNFADIRTANKVKEMMLMQAALALSGMYLVRDDGVINPDNIQIVQGGMIPVAATGGSMGASMVPLQTGREFDLGQFVLNDLQASIRAGMFANALPQENGKSMSPTEIIHRMRELTQDIGGAIGRLTRELVNLVRRVISILHRRGFLPEIKLDQYNFKVQINSPLARAQHLNQVQTAVQWWDIARGIGGEQLAGLIGKPEELIVYCARLMGVSGTLLRSEDEQQDLQQKIAAIFASQQAAAAPAAQAA